MADAEAEGLLPTVDGYVFASTPGAAHHCEGQIVLHKFDFFHVLQSLVFRFAYDFYQFSVFFEFHFENFLDRAPHVEMRGVTAPPTGCHQYLR